MKKLCCLLFALTLWCCFALPLQASAETEGIYEYTVSDGKATITDCDLSAAGDLIIPDTLGGYPVTTIGDWAFAWSYTLTSVTIPDSVTTIGWGSFCGSSNLTSVSIPNSVTTIGGRAFSDCNNLTYNIYDNGTYLGNSTNPYMVLVEAVADDITSCAVHPNTEFIGYRAFYDCNDLTDVTIPDSVTDIGDSAFCACYDLANVTIPDSVATIGNSAFGYCASLTTVTIPDSVTTIGDSAFYSCTSLTSVTIPNGVTDIGGDAFSHCDSLTGIWVSENNPNYASDNRGVLFNKDKTVLIQAPGALSGSYPIPDGVTTICDSAFFFCSVTSVTIPEGVTTIAGGTFSFSSVKEVTIPDSVTTIGEYAFSYCVGLTYNDYCGAHYLGNSGNPYHAFMGGDSDAATCIIHRDTKMIAACAFEVCENLTDVYYENTEKQWENVAIGDWNGYLLSATIHFAAAQIGDLDGNETIDEDDAIYLLQYVLMPELFPVEQTVDYDGSGEINEDDAIYLLQHVLMPDLFPIE